jgi:hypothetical protein
MSVSDLGKTTTYIGHFDVTDVDIKYTAAKTWSEFRNMGSIVYFMYVKDRLMKIGIAGNAGGWNGRVGMYKAGAGPRGDATNRLILKAMKDISETRIDIYAVSVPKTKITFTCPLTGDIINDEIEVNQKLEKSLTKRYLEENSSHSLPFSKQLK